MVSSPDWPSHAKESESKRATLRTNQTRKTYFPRPLYEALVDALLLTSLLSNIDCDRDFCRLFRLLLLEQLVVAVVL
eukprot:4490049-Amphidinium_carterae.4